MLIPKSLIKTVLCSTLFTAALLLASGCASTGRILVIKSDPADADVCIKGKANSEYFSNQKACVGTTPYEADRVVVVDPSGDKRVVKFKDVESDKESFYVVVGKPGYVAQALEVPEWDHTVTLRPEGQPAPATALANPTLPPSNAVRSEQSAMGVIRISSEPTGALVYINDVLKGNTPFTYEGPAGPIRMKLELTGFVSLDKILTVEAGQTYSLNFKLQSLQSANDVLQKSKPVQTAPIPIEGGRRKAVTTKAKSPAAVPTLQPTGPAHTTQ